MTLSQQFQCRVNCHVAEEKQSQTRSRFVICLKGGSFAPLLMACKSEQGTCKAELGESFGARVGGMSDLHLRDCQR